MKEEPEIPVLDDLINPGGKLEPAIGEGFEPATGDGQSATASPIDLSAVDQDLEIIDSTEYPSAGELLVEEEVRVILERHMQHALDEIMQLIRQRQSR